jgi:hypothetical protein
MRSLYQQIFFPRITIQTGSVGPGMNAGESDCRTVRVAAGIVSDTEASAIATSIFRMTVSF